MVAATVTSKGQITIPASVRAALGLRAGSRVEFVPTSEGTYELVSVAGSVRSLRGAVPTPVRAVSLAEMDRAVADGMAGEA
ncbi:AbrB/MazE/SpoVT family DNA-binding domain-containing protein [Aquipuribacter nitratireducens]|uniref:AbrB/MazE/SpoVT family DNA-binding domain-containing protein n=1 Tax=Aquipuribacter nitratireducens TaxID=650104 RepID=A0ABW0GHK7_9MICO